MNRPVHLLTHEFLPYTGGIGVYAQETASALAHLGILTTVWAPDYGMRSTDNLPYRVNRVAMRGKQDWQCRWRMAKALRAAFPDRKIPGTVILAEPGPVRLWMYQRMLKLPRPERLVVILHGSEILGLSRVGHRRAFLGRLLESADCVGVVSQAVAGMVMETYPDVASKLVLVPGAVRSGWQALPPVPREAVRPIREVVQIGRISPRKGQLVLIEAISRLPEPVLKRVMIRLIGPASDDRYLNGIESVIKKQSLPVHVEGVISDAALRETYEHADILVQPSQPYRSSIEGLGLTLLEAAHFGCPVIGTRTGGIPEALLDGKTGLLVPPEDPGALAKALEHLLEYPDEAARMGGAGAEFVRATFSWERNACLLTGGRPPADPVEMSSD